jgi:hypothetical protein
MPDPVYPDAPLHYPTPPDVPPTPPNPPTEDKPIINRSAIVAVLPGVLLLATDTILFTAGSMSDWKDFFRRAIAILASAAFGVTIAGKSLRKVAVIFAVASIATFGACTPIQVNPAPPDPIVVVPPKPEPQPQPDPQPNPKPPVGVLTYTQAGLVHEGMTREEVVVLLGYDVIGLTQDDGTTIDSWPAVGITGDSKWLEIQFTGRLPTAKVMGKVLTPRLP